MGYNGSGELRDRIARGNTVLRLEDRRTGSTRLDMVIFALRKFTGGMGDEDEAQPEDAQVWQKYFLRPMEEVEKVVCVVKENGEAAHLAVRWIEGRFFYICGSKNVHLIFRNREDLSRYSSTRYSVARTVGEAWLHQADTLSSTQLNLLLNLLHTRRLTLVMEVLNPEYQHVVSLSHLSSPSLRFLTLTQQYGTAQHSLTALPPHTCLDLGRVLGLETAQYQVIPASQAEERMGEVRAGHGYEGEVLYFLDCQDRTLGLIKKKTAWYVLARAVREKVNNATNQYRKFGGERGREHNLGKIDRRMEEIQTWLELCDQQTEQWKELGRGFYIDTMNQLLECPDRMEEVGARGNFPHRWRLYLEQGGLTDRDTQT